MLSQHIFFHKWKKAIPDNRYLQHALIDSISIFTKFKNRLTPKLEVFPQGNLIVDMRSFGGAADLNSTVKSSRQQGAARNEILGGRIGKKS